MTLKKTTMWALTLSMLVSCTNQAEKSSLIPGQDRQAQGSIIGGAGVDEKNRLSKTAVFLLMEQADPQDATKVLQSSCTGVMIDRDVVLTAAHCVLGIEAKNTYVFFSQDPVKNIEELAKSGKITLAQEIRIHPNFTMDQGNIIRSILRPYMLNGDVALIKIFGMAPADWNISELSSTYIDVSTRDLIAAGFGKTVSDIESQDPAPTILRTTNLRWPLAENEKKSNDVFRATINEILNNPALTLSEEEKKELNEILLLETYFPKHPQADYIFVDQTQGKGICQGDSGGAAFVEVEGDLVVVGLASHVENLFDAKLLCSYFGAYTNVLPYREWIESNYKELKAPLAPKETLFR